MIGHVENQTTVPIGCLAELDADARTLTLLEPGVQLNRRETTMSDAAVVGLLHPGEMGSAVGATLVASGARVLWASAGRGAQSRERAAALGLEDVGIGRRADAAGRDHPLGRAPARRGRCGA